MNRYISIILITLVFGCSQAQEPPKEPAYSKIIPGDIQIDASVIKPHKVKYTKSGGDMTYIMKEAKRNGKDVYELAIYFNSDESGSPDLIYIDKATLGYAGRHMEMAKYHLDVSFEKNRFTGELMPTPGSDYKKSVYDKTYPHNAFEPAVINYFITSLPLEKGYKASLPVFDLNNGSQMYWSNVEVLSQETIKIDGKKYETWKVLSKGIKEKTIWVTKEHPYAIKMKTKGNWGSWEVKEF